MNTTTRIIDTNQTDDTGFVIYEFDQPSINLDLVSPSQFTYSHASALGIHVALTA